MRRCWLAPSAALLALGGCAQVLGIEAGTESPWWCNANVAAPSGQTSYDFNFIDDTLKQVLPTVLLCAQSDPTCMQSTTLPLMNGALEFTLPASNDGYLKVSSPSPLEWPAIVELGPAGNVAPTKRTFPMFGGVDLTYLQATAGVMQDNEHGALLVAAYDCNEMPAEGVSIAVAIGGLPVVSSSLSFTVGLAPVMTGVSTSSTWLALVSNIPPSDAATVTLTRASDQVVVATALVHIHAQTFTAIYLGPTKTQ